MPFSRNGTVPFLLVRTRLTDPKMPHSNHNDAGREGVQNMAETSKQKKLGGSMQQNYRETTKYSHSKRSVFKRVLCFKTNPVKDKRMRKCMSRLFTGPLTCKLVSWWSRVGLCSSVGRMLFSRKPVVPKPQGRTKLS